MLGQHRADRCRPPRALTPEQLLERRLLCARLARRRHHHLQRSAAPGARHRAADSGTEHAYGKQRRRGRAGRPVGAVPGLAQALGLVEPERSSARQRSYERDVHRLCGAHESTAVVGRGPDLAVASLQATRHRPASPSRTFATARGRGLKTPRQPPARARAPGGPGRGVIGLNAS